MHQLIAAIPAEIRERIIQAANDLYEQSSRQNFPTVDQVRRAARVDMNAASSIMREWRRAQTAQAAPVAIHIPDAVVQANNQVLASLWSQAQELANESLRTAQAAWEAERLELDEMRQELAAAYETQAAEFEQAKTDIERMEKAGIDAQERAANELASIKDELAKAIARADRAEAQAGEIEKRVNDLRGELATAREEAGKNRQELSQAHTRAERAETHANEIENRAAELRGELEAVQKNHQALTVERDEIKAELTKAQTKAEAMAQTNDDIRGELVKKSEQLEKAIADAANAKERAAELTGKLTAIQEQNAALLSRLAPVSDQ